MHDFQLRVITVHRFAVHIPFQRLYIYIPTSYSFMNNKLESIKLLAFDIHRPKWSHSVVARGHPARNCAQTNNTSKKIYGFFSPLPSSPSPNGEKNRENVASHPVIVRQHSFRRNSINVTKLCRVQLRGNRANILLLVSVVQRVVQGVEGAKTVLQHR